MCTFNVVLEAEDFAEVKGSDCAFAFQPVDLPPSLGPMWVFGQTALRKYYTIYDAKKWQVGIGLAKHSAKKRQGALAQAGATDAPKKEPEVCEDDNKNMVWNHLPGCKSFASMGYCHRFSPLARKYCRLSCALCTVGDASAVELVGEKDLQESSSAPVQVAGSGMSISGARRGARAPGSLAELLACLSRGSAARALSLRKGLMPEEACWGQRQAESGKVANSVPKTRGSSSQTGI
ncbi:unnamed protein product [Effrenium voratum]|nr:unnamed protein product [Effrenium voratum]